MTFQHNLSRSMCSQCYVIFIRNDHARQGFSQEVTKIIVNSMCCGDAGRGGDHGTGLEPARELSHSGTANIEYAFEFNDLEMFVPLWDRPFRVGFSLVRARGRGDLMLFTKCRTAPAFF